MERQKLYKRFITLDWQQQLGNLASTLATLSQQSTNPKQDTLTIHLLREAALMIEWSASNVPQEFLLELAGMQRELLAWKKDFPIESARNILSLYARNQSDRLLQMSGLLEDNEKVELNSNFVSV
ncbi:hypothetical protein ACE1CI_35615 [Aerosakkonemataceae cyanobacterium BLCC-F50]|uniref:Uncharacterized protein n=1 Tax=Floridaenema flaviceps BLCC-F50 TaxID=3153642 RepID=A0ABV4Y2V2_9CYAN